MKRLLLHVGTHKTGTTAIQHVLYADRARLGAAGVHYDPARPKSQRGPKYAHHWVAHALARYDAADQDALERYRAELLQAPQDTILFSSEPFYRHADLSQGDNPRSAEHYLAARARYLDRVATYFAPFQTEISLYFRRPDRYLESLYKENAASNNLRISFEAYRASSPPCFLFRYQDRLDDWQSRFDKVAVHCFETACKTDLMDSFYAAHDLPALGPDAPTPPSRGSVSLRAALWLVAAKQGDGLSDRDRKRRWLYALSKEGKAQFQSPVKEMFWKDDAERQDFVDQSLTGFAHSDFWKFAPEALKPIVWDEAEQARAEAAYQAWQHRNKGYLRRREAMGLSPYMGDDGLLPVRKGLIGALRRAFNR